MFKILKDLNKSIMPVIAIILLLCVQAWADLTLPDYRSRIVDIIQQNTLTLEENYNESTSLTTSSNVMTGTS